MMKKLTFFKNFRGKSQTGKSECLVRLVVAVRRKIQLYYWKNRKFFELQPDINLPDYPKSLAWCKNAICVGYRSEYGLVMLESYPGVPPGNLLYRVFHWKNYKNGAFLFLCW